MAKALPKQGTRAVLNAWSDANEQIVKNGNKRKKAEAQKKGKKKK